MPILNKKPQVLSVAGKRRHVVLSPADIDGLTPVLDATERTANKDQPNGYPGLDPAGNVVGTITFRQGDTATIGGIVGQQGEPLWNTQLKVFTIGDGATAGGVPIGKPVTRTIDKSNDATGSFFIDHQNADVVVIRAYTPVGVNRTFTASATTPADPLVHPAFGAQVSQGITSGSYVGQRLQLRFLLRGTPDPDLISGGAITVTLSGTRFGWNADNAAMQGTASRTVINEPNYVGDILPLSGGATIDLWWDGTWWREVRPDQNVGSIQSNFALAVGYGVSAAPFSIACGRAINVGALPQFSITVGDQCKSLGSYSWVGGFGTSGPFGGNYVRVLGRNITFGATAWSDAYVDVLGNGARSRVPLSRNFGHSFNSTDWGSCMAGDYLYSAQTTDATPTRLLVRGGDSTNLGTIREITVPPRTCLTFFYQLAAVDRTGGANCAKATGEFTIWRDNAGNTAILHQAEYSRANTPGFAGFGFTIAADDVNERPAFTVTGFAATSARWVLRLTSAEAGGSAVLP